jgi:hypothetical protein
MPRPIGIVRSQSAAYPKRTIPTLFSGVAESHEGLARSALPLRSNDDPKLRNFSRIIRHVQPFRLALHLSQRLPFPTDAFILVSACLVRSVAERHVPREALLRTTPFPRCLTTLANLHAPPTFPPPTHSPLGRRNRAPNRHLCPDAGLVHGIVSGVEVLSFLPTHASAQRDQGLRGGGRKRTFCILVRTFFFGSFPYFWNNWRSCSFIV